MKLEQKQWWKFSANKKRTPTRDSVHVMTFVTKTFICNILLEQPVKTTILLIKISGKKQFLLVSKKKIIFDYFSSSENGKSACFQCL